MTHQSTLVQKLVERGFLHQATHLEELDEAATKSIVTGYIGFDATAKSFHVGNLTCILMLRNLQKAGHKPIVIMGGGTTKVGDPSGKDEARKMLSDEDIEANIKNLQKTFSKFITFGDGPTDAIMLNNDEWLSQLSYIDFLRDYGRHFSINRMLTFESVKQRLDREQPLTFLEFNYSILQAYDFMHLAQKHNCSLQLGGSDQWGNIVSGVDLTRRVTGKDVFGFTCPLITTSSGAKMGKSAAGAVWLNEDMLSPYDYFQFWRNTEDNDVGRFLRLYTELPLEEVEKLEKLEGAAINDAKKRLAFEATKMCHGEAEAQKALETAEAVFKQGGVGDDLPVFDISHNDIDAGFSIIKALVTAKLCASNGEARRLIAGGGARINNERVGDENFTLSPENFDGDKSLKLSAGKKKHVILKLKS